MNMRFHQRGTKKNSALSRIFFCVKLFAATRASAGKHFIYFNNLL